MNSTSEEAKKAPGSVTPAAYNAFVGAARLREIRLIESAFNLAPEAEQFALDWRLLHECEVQQANFDASAELLTVLVRAEASCKKKNKRLLSAKCRYLVIYNVQGSPPEEAVSAFAKRVARFAAYPYFRGHFAETTAQAGLMLPPLPVIKEARLLPNPEAKKLEVRTGGQEGGNRKLT